MGPGSWLEDEDVCLELFGTALESQAREVPRPRAADVGAAVSPLRQIQEELALKLDQIDRLRTREQDILRQLRQAECDINTELMQMEQRTPRYSPYRYPEREKLQRRLAGVGRERRQLTIALAEKLDALHDRLLSLLHKHRQLDDGAV